MRTSQDSADQKRTTSDGAIMPAACPSVRTEWDMALSAIAAGNAATLDIAEAMRGDMPIADNLRHRETAEQLADCLRSVLALLHGAPPEYENIVQRGRYDDGCRLLVAVQDYLDGWPEDTPFTEGAAA